MMSNQSNQNIDGLPKDWSRVKLESLVENPKQDLVDGPFGSNLKAHEYVENGIPVFKIQNIKANRFVDKNLNYVTKEKAASLARHSFKKGDLIITKLGDPLGLCCKVPDKYDYGIIVADLMRLRPSPLKVYDKYLINVINSEVVQSQFKKITKGTTRPRVNLTIVREIEIPLPPMEVQQQIVSKIEELFSELDTGIEELKTAQQKLKVYRQSVLKWAFEGKLTNENVEEGELPYGWKITTIGDVCKSVEYGSATKSKTTGKVPVLRMGNIQNGIFEWDDLVYTDDEDEINKYLLRKNDVLFNRTNSAELVGKTAIFKCERPAIFAGYLIRINRFEDKIDSGYLTYYLNSKQAKSYGNSVRSFGVNQSNINGTKLKTYPLPLPPLVEQQLIVQEIENRLSVCDKIEETIADSLKQAEALRQSILKKAFEGELSY